MKADAKGRFQILGSGPIDEPDVIDSIEGVGATQGVGLPYSVVDPFPWAPKEIPMEWFEPGRMGVHITPSGFNGLVSCMTHATHMRIVSKATATEKTVRWRQSHRHST